MQCYYNLFNIQCVLHKKILILCTTDYLVNKMGRNVSIGSLSGVTSCYSLPTVEGRGGAVSLPTGEGWGGAVSLPTGEGWGGAVCHLLQLPPYGGGLGWGFVSDGESAPEMRGGRL